jgi:hypothetical protein
VSVAQTIVTRPMAELLSMDEPRRRIAAMLTALDVQSDLGVGHPLLGRRMPDLDLHTADGPTRLFTLHDARPVVLHLGASGRFDISPWADRVRFVDARYDGPWQLPVLGEVAAPPAALIRPDGHVAWTGDLANPELPRALTTWCGAALPVDCSSPGGSEVGSGAVGANAATSMQWCRQGVRLSVTSDLDSERAAELPHAIVAETPQPFDEASQSRDRGVA